MTRLTSLETVAFTFSTHLEYVSVVYSVPPSTPRPQIQPNLAPGRKSIQGISLAQPHGCVVYRVRRTARRRCDSIGGHVPLQRSEGPSDYIGYCNITTGVTF